MKYKLVIVVREDLKVSPGKLAAQVAHAAVECVLQSDRELINLWRKEGAKKVVLKVPSLCELLEIYKQAKDLGLTSVLIRDAGLTEVEPGTITCVGIGPDLEEKIDKVTGNLKLYR
jgi:PTH2 family peptidyl-tRNA hydrolase